MELNAAVTIRKFLHALSMISVFARKGIFSKAKIFTWPGGDQKLLSPADLLAPAVVEPCDRRQES